MPAEEGPERLAARDEVLAAETVRTVAARGATRIVQTHHGFVMAAAGIDASNVDASKLVLLPKDPDASARALRAALRRRHGADVAVIVSDTMGRPWRNGLTDVALGVAGMSAIRDHRGEVDPYGNELSITQMAVVDELAGAGELIKGKCDQVPVAVVRGYLTAPTSDDGTGRPEPDPRRRRRTSSPWAPPRPARPGCSPPRPSPTTRARRRCRRRSTEEALTPGRGRRSRSSIADGTRFTPVTDAAAVAQLGALLDGWPATATAAVITAAWPMTPAPRGRGGADPLRRRRAPAARGAGRPRAWARRCSSARTGSALVAALRRL